MYKVSITHGAIIDLLKLGCVMFLTHIAYKGVLWALNYDNNHKGEGGNSTIHNTKTDKNTLHSKGLISAQIDNKNRPSQCVTQIIFDTLRANPGVPRPNFFNWCITYQGEAYLFPPWIFACLALVKVNAIWCKTIVFNCKYFQGKNIFRLELSLGANDNNAIHRTVTGKVLDAHY